MREASARAAAAAAALILVLLQGCSSLLHGGADAPHAAPALAAADQVVVHALRQPEPAPLPRDTLRAFFKHDLDRLALLCHGSRHCRERERGTGQLEAFFKGSYLRAAPGAAAYEGASSVDEAYAFHATEYFSDPAYACRHPLVAQVLESAWQRVPARRPSCNPLLPFLVTESGQAARVRWVDPERVHAVHLLFAGEAGQSMSSFGHVSLRIITCNKDRSAIDERCESDLFDHISLGFKAHIDEIDLSLWKGIAGGYPVKLYAQAFLDAYREYSVDEFRAVHSLPLVLEPRERRSLLQALSEVHWSYSNDYRFFTRNCATEVQWLVNSVLATQRPSGAAFFPQARLRPDHLFADARASANFKGSVLLDLAKAEASGHHFPSAKDYYQLAAQTVLAQLPTPDRATTPEQWLAQDTAFRREHWLLPALAGTPARGLKRTAHAALVMESWVERVLRRQVMAGLGAHYTNLLAWVADDKQLLSESENRLLTSCLQWLKTADTAGTHDGGIPQDGSQAAAVAGNSCDVGNTELASLMKKLFEMLPSHGAEREALAQLQEAGKNILLLQAHASP